MSSFLGRGRDVDDRLGLAEELGPAEIRDCSCEVKASVLDEDISRDDFCLFAGLGAPYKGASFADVFLCDIILKVTMVSRFFDWCGVKKVPTVAGAAVAPKPLHHREAAADDSHPLESHMVLEKLHLPIHHNNQEAEYVIRPLSEMPTPRQVYVAVIGIQSPKSAPPSPRLHF